VVEATSGNTGIALAMVCAAKGYPFVALMSETFSIERRKIMRALGAKVILTPAAERGSGMVRIAEELRVEARLVPRTAVRQRGQSRYHASTTGPEILRDFAERRLDWFVTGWGTGGTLSGVGRVLKTARPEVRICRLRAGSGGPAGSGEEWKPHRSRAGHPISCPSVLDRSVVDRTSSRLMTFVARDTARLLAHKEGLFVGLSSGATFAAALQLAKGLPNGSSVLAMLPDTGERYLSTFLFEGVNEGSDEEWLASLPV
jgi:cysteine synthase A